MRNLAIPVGAVMMLALPGCTPALIEAAEKVEIREHSVADVTQAWLGADGRLTVCASGWPAKRSRNLAASPFHVSVLLEAGQTANRPPPRPLREAAPVGRLSPGPGAPGEGCPARPAGAAEVEIVTVPADSPGRPQVGAQEIARAGWEADGAGPKLWFLAGEAVSTPEPKQAGVGSPTKRVTGAPEAATPEPNAKTKPAPAPAAILYRHDAPLYRGSRMVWIDPGGEKTGPRRGLYVLLPLAVAGDVVGLASGGVLLLALGAMETYREAQ